ncbi:U3 small nucleolar RNA-associated protein 25 homolog [Engraulis encrasicolus]|uniref:U3 small nucleolar RNA-associated protein 25 homolog n=1 Tax=Engraulis encrasicolus TaxID=184585 RepID=UPI002FD5F6D4
MGKRQRKQNEAINKLTKKQKKHLKEFGEEHPFHDSVGDRQERTQIVHLRDSPERRKVERDNDDDEDAELEEQPSAYQKLLGTLDQSESDGEEDESDEEEDEEELLEGEGEEEEEDEEVDEDGEGDEEEESEAAEAKPSLKEDDTEADEEVLDEAGDKKADQGGEEFTDKKHESQFCLETNIPTEGDPDTAEEDGATDGKEDMFTKHTETELTEEEIKQLAEGKRTKTQIKWPKLGNLLCSTSMEKFPAPGQASSLPLPPLHKALQANWTTLNQALQPQGAPKKELSDLQKELLGLMGTYRDVYMPECSPLAEGKEVRGAYCLHVLNHVLKANSNVLTHNAQLKEGKITDDETRDQGLTRPKALIVVPFRDGALQVVQTFIHLLEPKDKKKMDVSNKKRFKDEFGDDPEDRPPKVARPDDYDAIFSGNVDDHFRIGISILKRSIRLFAPFYSADIIVASPLGLRTLLGVEGEKKRDFDFLSSIEVLVLDQADVLLMQNWEHVLHMMKHMNLQPLDSHGVDFSRVRMWNLNSWAKFYRQTLVFSSIQEPQINNILTKHSFNYRGQIATKNLPKVGSICQVLVQLPHVFQLFNSDSFMDQDARFQFFVDKVLPQYRDSVMSHTFIYVPSYFDFVRIRNYLKKEEVNFTALSEYSQRSEVSRARHYFQKGNIQFLLFSERFHFYKRYTIKGMRHLIFYGLPTYPHFYSEVCNMLQAGSAGADGSEAASWTCTALYSRYDAHKLAAIAGAERAAQMLQSKKPVHLFITGEDKTS